jgi:hypothetical protein
MSNQCNISSKSDLYNQILWGNKNLTVNKESLFNINFIESDIIYVSDVLLPNGTVDESIYHKLHNKREYIFVIEKIKKALTPYRHFKSNADELVIKNKRVIMEDIISKRSKYFYMKIIQHKTVQPKTNAKWCRELDIETVNWKEIYSKKLKTALDPRMLEFNFKILMNILATKLNLFRWKKVNSPLCIYCHDTVQDSKHLLYECAHTYPLWNAVSQILNINITWKHVVTGDGLNDINNAVITLVAYSIYKKFQIEKEFILRPYENIITYIKNELASRKCIYEVCIHKNIYRNVINVIELLRNHLN